MIDGAIIFENDEVDDVPTLQLIYGDEQRLELILVNLIKNAVQNTASG